MNHISKVVDERSVLWSYYALRWWKDIIT